MLLCETLLPKIKVFSKMSVSRETCYYVKHFSLLENKILNLAAKYFTLFTFAKKEEIP